MIAHLSNLLESSKIFLHCTASHLSTEKQDSKQLNLFNYTAVE